MIKLKMVHDSPASAPTPRVASGFTLRGSQESDHGGLIRLYRLSDLGVETPAELEEKLLSHESYRPDHVLVIEKGTRLVATAAAFIDREDHTQGFLHMVSVDPLYRGKGLGSWLVCSALRLHASLGLDRQWLLTDPWRLAAIRLYLSLGYRPSADESQTELWDSVLAQLDGPHENPGRHP
jgi:mycothiol synthase